MSSPQYALRAENVSLNVPKSATTQEGDKKQLLDNISFNLSAGKMLGVIGPNGAGKSSLLKVLARLQAASTGQCLLHEKNLQEYSLKEFSQHLAYLEQSPQVAWSLQVEHVVNLAFLNKPFNTLQKKDYAEKALRQAQVWELRHRVMNTLSGGERMRVMLARMFASQSKVLLLDEPLASLDPFYQLELLNSLQEFVRDGGSVCVVLHDLNHAYTYCDEVLLLDQGHVYAHGSAQDVLSEENINTVYGVKAKIHASEGGSKWIQLSA